jgi:molybdopterin-guanine dinucleotide biosynthesis protein A
MEKDFPCLHGDITDNAGTFARPADLALTETTIVLLAGGLGTRLGGPKADLVIDGEPVLARAKRRFAGHRIALSLRPGQTPEHIDLFDQVFFNESPDPTPGELARSLIARLNRDGVLLPIDMPDVSAELLAELLATLHGDRALLGAMFTREGKPEPLPLAFRPGLAELLRTRLEQGGRSLRGVVTLPVIACVPLPERFAGEWTHLNDPRDVAALGHRVTLRA